MSVTLGELGLKRLSKSIDAALQTLHTTLVHSIKPLLEELVFTASEIHGLTRLWKRASSIGLAEDAAKDMLAATERGLLAAEYALSACGTAATSFRNFFLWLQQYMRRREARLDGCMPRRVSSYMLMRV